MRYFSWTRLLASVYMVLILAVGLQSSASASSPAVQDLVTGAVELAPAINEASTAGAGQPTNTTFYDHTVTVDYVGGPICLSSQSDVCSPPATDDAVRIFVNGNPVFYHESYTYDYGPVDFSGFLNNGSNSVHVQEIDLLGPTRGGSALWLVPATGGGGSGPCDGGLGLEVPAKFPFHLGPLNFIGADNFAYKYEQNIEFSVTGKMCPETPLALSVEGDPAFVARSKYGETRVNAKGEMESTVALGPSHDVGLGTSTVVPLSLSVIDNQKYSDKKGDLELEESRKLEHRLTVKPSAPAQLFTLSAGVIMIIKYYPEVEPVVVEQLPALLYYIPLQRAESKPIHVESAVPNVTPPPTDVLNDLRNLYGPETVDGSTVGLLTLDRTIKGPGQNVTYDGAGFTPNGKVLMLLIRTDTMEALYNEELGANASGQVHGKLRLPNNIPAARWVLTLVDNTRVKNDLTAFTSNGTIPHPYLLANTLTVPPYRTVKIDIKPESEVNPINLGDKGVIPVGLLTTPNFDAHTVAPLTLEFGPDAALEKHGTAHWEDVDNDGDIDAMLHFPTQRTGILKTDTAACLWGQTKTGEYISGCDSVHIVPINKKNK